MRLATYRQLDYMRILGIEAPENCTCLEACRLIAEAVDKIPATEKQIRYMQKMFIEYPENCSKQKASQLIDKFIEDQAPLQDSRFTGRVGRPSGGFLEYNNGYLVYCDDGNGNYWSLDEEEEEQDQYEYDIY